MDKGPVDRLERPLIRAERPEKIRLGELLVELRLISIEQLRSVLEEHLRSGQKVGKLLVDGGHITDDQLGQAIAKLYRAPFIDLKKIELDPDVVRQLPEAQARHHKAIVIRELGQSLLVGLTDPSDLFAIDEVTRLLKRDIKPAVVVESHLTAAIDKHYRKSDQISGLAKELEDDIGDSGSNGFGSGTAADDSAVARLVASMFDDAVRLGASDIHIEPQESRLVVRVRVDGIMQAAMDADPKIASALLSRIKILAELNISERRLPQDGRLSIAVGSRQLDVRLSTLPTQYGESAVLRILSTGSGPRKLEKLGMPAGLLERFQRAMRRSNGLVLVVGPTGSGKTTTLYSALNTLNTVDTKIITVEDPVEYRLPGITQVQINEKIELSFGIVLRSVLRQDPDVILVGEMRDQETAQIGLRAAITGHLVFSTLHTRDAASTPIRLIDMGVPPVMVATALQAVLAQRLIRVICEYCATPTPPSGQEMAWLHNELGGVPSGANFMRGRGCPRCLNSGYHGRMGIYELLEMNADLVALANRNDPDGFMRLAQQVIAGETLQSHGLRLAAEGKTTIEEVMRVASQVGD